MSSLSLHHLTTLLAKAEQAVLAAGAHINSLRKNSASLVSTRKKDGSLVMKLDNECEQIATTLLTELLPVVSEEDESTHKNRDTQSLYYLLDPLDGTSACRRFFREKHGQIGFGPLVGIVSEGKLCGATFYHIPNKTVYSALVGQGTRKVAVKSCDLDWRPPEFLTRRRLPTPKTATSLTDSAMLFYISHYGEGSFLDMLKQQQVFANFYRFGGFANDCIRLATGREDLLMQLSIKPWDLAASLLPSELGFEVNLWNGSKFVELSDWDVQANNPLFIAPPHLKGEFSDLLEEFLLRRQQG
jgi:fructose-1,6-bisphosphatase/inositol monophosphatase family enzyme